MIGKWPQSMAKNYTPNPNFILWLNDIYISAILSPNNSDFLDLTHKVLKLSGYLFMSTDWENYAESIEESINQNSIFEVLTSSSYEHLKLTKFQQKAIDEGRKIYHFSLKKIS
mgnify:CR=1 FL=1